MTTLTLFSSIRPKDIACGVYVPPATTAQRVRRWIFAHARTLKVIVLRDLHETTLEAWGFRAAALFAIAGAGWHLVAVMHG